MLLAINPKRRKTAATDTEDEPVPVSDVDTDAQSVGLPEFDEHPPTSDDDRDFIGLPGLEDFSDDETDDDLPEPRVHVHMVISGDEFGDEEEGEGADGEGAEEEGAEEEGDEEEEGVEEEGDDDDDDDDEEDGDDEGKDDDEENPESYEKMKAHADADRKVRNTSWTSRSMVSLICRTVGTST